MQAKAAKAEATLWKMIFNDIQWYSMIFNVSIHIQRPFWPHGPLQSSDMQAILGCLHTSDPKPLRLMAVDI